jgi:hypothetical protein
VSPIRPSAAATSQASAQAEQRVKTFLLLEQVEDGLADLAKPVLVIAGKHRQVADDALDRQQFRRAHLFVRRGYGDHHRNQRVLRGHRG